ncbi:MAG: phospholipase D-like domain-containing protein [Candidatus Nanoarchaeia archaeon]
MKLKHLLIILILLLVIGLLLIDLGVNKENTKHIYENGSIDVYFCPETDCNKEFVEQINSSETTLCAFYELTDYRVKDVLIAKNASLIIHHENYNDFGISRETNGLMHSKFCVLDNKKIFTGSHNPTMNENKDNILIIESEYLAANYNNEFDNLKNGLHNEEKAKTKYTKIIFNGYELENYFCPQDGCQRQILEELNKANSSIYFMTFTFTDKEIANALINKKIKDLDVRGIIESYQGRTYWVYPQLTEANILVVLDSEKSLQHSKVFIVDNKTVMTGSFNPTKSADTKNDENIIIIRQPEIVQKYVDEFERLYVELGN